MSNKGVVDAFLDCIVRNGDWPCLLAYALRPDHPLSTSWCACGLGSSSVLAAVLDAHTMADSRASTELAEASVLVVLTDARSTA